MRLIEVVTREMQSRVVIVFQYSLKNIQVEIISRDSPRYLTSTGLNFSAMRCDDRHGRPVPANAIDAIAFALNFASGELREARVSVAV